MHDIAFLSFADPDGGCVAFVMNDERNAELRVFTLPDCHLRCTVPLNSTSCRVGISLPADRFAVATWSGGLSVYELSTGKTLWSRKDVAEAQEVWIRDGVVFCTEMKKRGLRMFTLAGEPLPVAKAIMPEFWKFEPNEIGYTIHGSSEFAVVDRDLRAVLHHGRAANTIREAAVSTNVMLVSLFGRQPSIWENKPADEDPSEYYSQEYPPFQVWYISEDWIEGVPPNHLGCNNVYPICYSRIHDSFFAVYSFDRGDKDESVLVRLGPDCLETEIIGNLKYRNGFSFSGDGSYVFSNGGDVYKCSDGALLASLW